MTYRGYSEMDLVANRASLLIHGGSANDRRAWAEEAMRSFEGEGPLREVHNGAELLPTLSLSRGVVFIPDIGGLTDEDQARITRTLLEHEERPKFVIALGDAPEQAMANGKLRMDLGYRLSQAVVDLSSGELKERIKARRQQAEAAAAKLAAKLASKAGRGGSAGKVSAKVQKSPVRLSNVGKPVGRPVGKPVAKPVAKAKRPAPKPKAKRPAARAAARPASAVRRKAAPKKAKR